MTALGKTRDEIGDMPFPDVGELLTFWRKHPPTHILLGILAEQKVWKRPPDYSQAAVSSDLLHLVGNNRVPLKKLPADVSQMFADIRNGKIPGLKPLA